MTNSTDAIKALDVADLTDRTDGFGCEHCEDRISSWRFEARGTTWWTDRHIIVRDDLVTGSDDTPALASDNAKRAAALIAEALDGELGEPTAGFSVELAGPLTETGMVARSISADSKEVSMHALVRDGQVVGAIMPRKPGVRKDERVTLPVPPEVLRLHRQIRDLASVTDYTAWILAGGLAAAGSEAVA